MVGPHEVAHQWWGHIIGWKTYRDQWMSEGFADFSASLFLHAVYKKDKFIEFWKNQREQLLQKNRFGKRPIDVGSVTMGYRIDSARTQGIGRDMLYPKGAYILHMIRMMMFDARNGGDQRFITMMRDVVKTHFNQNVSTEDFQKIVDKHLTPLWISPAIIGWAGSSISLSTVPKCPDTNWITRFNQPEIKQ
jgi:aminopeptidase N